MTEPRKRSPAEVWRALEKASTDAEVGRIGAMSDAELDAELRAAGIDPAEAAKIGVDLLPPAPPSRRAGRRVYWVAGFAAAVVVIGVLVVRPRTPAVGAGYGEEDALAEADDLRNHAFGACDQAHWAVCKKALNDAKDIDPAGEAAPRVVAARRAIAAAEVDAGRLPEEPPKP